MAIRSGLKFQSEIIEPGDLRTKMAEVQKVYENSPICAFNIDQQVCHSALDFSKIIVEIAQKEILSIARRLSDSGEIMLGGGAGDEFL